MLNESNVINSFRGKYFFLSNFYVVSLTMDDGKEYATSEHAYQAAKMESKKDAEKVRLAASPSVAKKLGNELTAKEGWDFIKIDMMKDIVEVKFFQNVEIYKKLLETGKAHLVEGNTWKDDFWGVYQGVGDNHLGKILMEIREEASDWDIAILTTK
jgi:hypothetical protein